MLRDFSYIYHNVWRKSKIQETLHIHKLSYDLPAAWMSAERFTRLSTPMRVHPPSASWTLPWRHLPQDYAPVWEWGLVGMTWSFCTVRPTGGWVASVLCAKGWSSPLARYSALSDEEPWWMDTALNQCLSPTAHPLPPQTNLENDFDRCLPQCALSLVETVYA